MATTDTRSGFRLPWSSDRSHDTQPEQPANAADASPETPEAADISDGSGMAGGEAWPDVDVNSRLGRVGGDPGTADSITSPNHSAKEPAAMVDTFSASAPPPVGALRKPSKLLAELAAAMRATAETAREQALAQVEADARQVVEAIRAHSTEGAAELRRRSDEDIAAIRDWSKAEIARIREETDQRIGRRKATLESEIAGHAAAIEQRVVDVQGAVSAYETDMAEFFERLLQESDPARLATMAESMPEPPSLAAWADLDDLDIDIEATASVDTGFAMESETQDDAASSAESGIVPDGDESGMVDAEPVAMTEETPVGEIATEDQTDATTATAEFDPWAGTDDGWAVQVSQVADAESTTADEPDVARWEADEPVDHPTGDTGEPVDRGAIMAALEAAAEAVVAAEAAAESADQAAESADVAETAAELLVGRVDSDDEIDADAEAEAALAARVDAGGFETEPSLADRLHSLLPGGGEASDGQPTSTQVVVTGLVSVASIASFKRHLGRVAGVQSVSVASGPDGEFMFNVTHRPDVSFRDVVPTLPGFAARVTGTGEGVVNVTARDPETEG